MKIALAQINPTVGDYTGNTKLINKIIKKYNDVVDIIVFPEMALTGYPPQDLLFDKNFVNESKRYLKEIAKETNNTVVIVGSIRIEKKDLYNTAAILQNGTILEYIDKSLLPSYDVFDEKRYFSPNNDIKPIILKTKSKETAIGLHICEDLWNNEYSTNVLEELFQKGVDIFINISASPYYLNKSKERYEIIKSKVRKYKRPFIYCNLIGGQGELIFDGGSIAFNKEGKCIKQAEYFEEEVVIIDTNSISRKNITFEMKDDSLLKALSLGVRDYFKKTSHNKAIIGLSGGIDSALTAAIASVSIGSDNIIGVSMPSKYSSSHSIKDAKLLAANLGIEFKIIPIKEINEIILDSMNGFLDKNNPGLAEENLQARIRGNILMVIANKIGGLVLNTGNKTETALGYCTLYGDMCGAIGVISDLNKTEVYSLAYWFNEKQKKEIIPMGTLKKEPSAELRPNQVDPFDYDKISPFVEQFISNNSIKIEGTNFGLSKEESCDIKNKIIYSEYKRRQSSPGLKISKKAFGVGRRFPIVNRFTNIK